MANLDMIGEPKAMQHVTLLDGGMGQELFLRSKKPATPLFSAQAMLDDPAMVILLHCDFIDKVSVKGKKESIKIYSPRTRL